MNILLENTGKRYNREWIFRNLNHIFLQGHAYAITGVNGSGKSTLLQIIGGAIMHSEGKIGYQKNMAGMGTPTMAEAEKTYRQIAIAAPYLDLPDEMTANELLKFHSAFKPLTKPFAAILSAVGLEKASHKQIRYFSSGMKQRLKLAQAFFSDTSVLLLDEPLTNLDEEGIAVYKKLWEENTSERLVIVSSNDKQEYENCEEVIAMENYK